jgi:hypothetical protein
MVISLRIQSPVWAAFLSLTATLLATPTAAQLNPGDVTASQEVSDQAGGFTGSLDTNDGFGLALASLGDLDGDGVNDLAVGTDQDDDGGHDRGAIWILFMNTDGTVRAHQKISDTDGGFTGQLSNNDGFGRSLAALGDLDGDGVEDLAVGSIGDGAGGNNRGAVWVLFLNTDGTVRAHQKITDGESGFTGPVDVNDGFARSMGNIGDLNGDGVVDIAVGADRDSTNDTGEGALWILFLATDGQVVAQQKIAESTGGFTGLLDADDGFGRSVSSLGDLDGDGTLEVAVGADGDDDGGIDRGAAWVLSLATDGTVSSLSKISSGSGFGGALADGDAFGTGMAAFQDLDGDGNPELVVGAPGDDDGGPDRGAAWVLFLAGDGSVASQLKISATANSFQGALSDGDGFGTSLATLADIDGDGLDELTSGAPGNDGASANTGAAWVLFLEGVLPEPPSQPYSGFTNSLDGRPGRAGLVVPEPPDGAPPPPDFIFVSVLVVPDVDDGLVRPQGLQANPDGSLTYGGGEDKGTGEGPTQAGTGSFIDGSPTFASLGATNFQPDIVTVNRDSDSVSVLEGLADGTFADQVETLLDGDTRPISVGVGDFNEDSRDDVVVAGAAGLSVLIGDGASGFSQQNFMPIQLLTDVAVGFINDDAHLDVLTASGAIASSGGQEFGFATVLLGNGDGTLTNMGSFASGHTVASVLLGDMNGDGVNDALVASHELAGGPAGEPQGVLDVYVGDGNGGFSLSTTFPGHRTPDVGGIHPTYGAVADIDGDLLMDAVYLSSDNLSFPPGAFGEQHPPLVATILRNQGAGLLEVTQQGTAYSGKGISVVLRDISPVPPDGLRDAILVWYEDVLAGTGSADQQFQTQFGVLTAQPSGTFFDPATNQLTTGAEPGDGYLADVNAGLIGGGPPALDLVIPNRADNSISVLIGDGTGGFTPGQTILGVDELDPAGLPPGAWVGGPRSLEFSAVSLFGGIGLYGFAMVAYNSWEDTTLVSPAPSVFASLSLYSGGLTGFFNKVQYLPLARGGEFTQADLTDDDNTDIVVTQRLGPGTDELHVHVGLGPTAGEVSTTAVVYPVPSGHALTGGIFAADVVGDESLDVVSSSVDGGGAGHVLVYENSGGVLLAAVAYPMGMGWNEILSLHVAEVTGDGLLDIVLGASNGRLIVAEGQPGSGWAFTSIDPVAASVAGGALAVGEIDGDDRLDVVSSNGIGSNGLGQAFVRSVLGGDSVFGGVQTIAGVASTTSAGAALRPLLGDVDNDGTTELVLVHGTSNSVSVFPNQFDSFERYGTGKPGTGGFKPLLDGLGYTVQGANTELVIQDALGGAPFLLQFGIGRTTALFPAVQTVLLQLLLTLSGTPGVAGDGSFSIPVELPSDPALIGLEFTLQAVVLDPGSGAPAPLGLSVTNGLAFAIVK